MIATRLINLRDALDAQEGETDEDQRLGWPLRQAAGAGRLLVDAAEARKKGREVTSMMTHKGNRKTA